MTQRPIRFEPGTLNGEGPISADANNGFIINLDDPRDWPNPDGAQDSVNRDWVLSKILNELNTWSDQDYPKGSVVRALNGDGEGNVKSPPHYKYFRATADIFTGDLAPHGWVSETYNIGVNGPPYTTGDVVNLSIGGSTISYTIQAGESQNSLVEHLIEAINLSAYADHVVAYRNGTAFEILLQNALPEQTIGVVANLPPHPAVILNTGTPRPAVSTKWQDITPQLDLEDLLDVDAYHKSPENGDILRYHKDPSKAAYSWQIHAGPSIFAWRRKEYKQGELVVHNGIIYKATKQISSVSYDPPDTVLNTDWKQITENQVAPITYYGEGSLDTAQATTAPRFGTPTNTIPDVTKWIPAVGDTYIDVLTGTITHWT